MVSIKHKRGTTAENDAYTGEAGTVSVDTEKNEIRLHDGITVGGWPMVSYEGLGDSNTMQVIFEGGTSVVTSDALNDFSFSIKGHAGGDSHLALGTDDDNSRLSLLCSAVTGDAPRLQLVGPQDVDTNIRGWMLFDYGSTEYDLPGAQLHIRFASTLGSTTAMSANSDAAVIFGNPTGGYQSKGIINAQGVMANGQDVTVFPSYTISTVPSAAANEGKPIYVTDLNGGKEPCFSDGVDWRRMSDKTIID